LRFAIVFTLLTIFETHPNAIKKKKVSLNLTLLFFSNNYYRGKNIATININSTDYDKIME